MSVKRAKLLMADLRWYHLGFAFFWATTFAALSNPSPDLADSYMAYSLIKQAMVVVALVGVAFVMRKRESYTHTHAVVAGAMLAAGSLLFCLTFFFGEFSGAAVLAAAVLVGGASGLLFVMWQSFYASEGASRTAIYIPLSAALSVVLCLAVSSMPPIWSVMCSVVVLPTLATVCLCRSLDEIVPYEIVPCTGPAMRSLVHDMGRPVFCVCALGFVWQMIGHLYADSRISFLMVMAGMAGAVLIVTLFELFSERGFDVMSFYQALFPLVTSVFLLPTLFGVQWIPVLSGFMMFGFEIVNLLLIITCAVYASDKSYNSTLVYALCVGPTLFALLCGDIAGTAFNHVDFYGFTLAIDVVFVGVYALSAALFFVSIGRSRRKAHATAHFVPSEPAPAVSGEVPGAAALLAPSDADASMADGSPATPSSSDTQTTVCATPAGASEAAAECDAPDADAASLPTLVERLEALSPGEPLSQREREVTDLLLHGNTVPAIARKLYISENTVRSHTKNIYRKLDVHSKQELIDLLG